MSDSTLKKTGIIVSHTHWDRAWYLTFQQFRHRMVRMVDRLITLLNEDPEYHSFTLDGQTILLDDYLEIKPYNEEVLRKLISSGKLVVGPWYILPDLFLVSGESVVRNIQIGLATARKFGASMQEGYVPDPFGHFAQLPQLLNQFGINSFIFMRGLDENAKTQAGSIFEWESPDGSSVLTTYLVEGYFNGASLGYKEQFGRFDGLTPDIALAKDRIKTTIENLAALQKESTFLINNGFDHMPEQPELPEIIRSINSNGNGTVVKHGTFRDFFDGVRTEQKEHQVIKGDLLGNVDHPILSSVFSTRVYLKQMNHLAQSLLERYVEPMILLGKHTTTQPDSSDFLLYAWKLLMQNHPHDDICGCSADGVHEDDEVRFRQVHELSQSLLIEQMEHLLRTGLQKPATSGDHFSEVFVFNPHPWKQTARVSTKILFANPDAEMGSRFAEKKLLAVDANGKPIPVTVTYSHPHTFRNNFLESSWGRRYDVHFDVELDGMGYHVVHVYESDELAEVSPTVAALMADVAVESPSQAKDDHQITKESAVVAKPKPVRTGTFVASDTELLLNESQYSVVFGKTGVRFKDFIRFEYQHDNGDTYTFGPVPSEGIRWADFKSGEIDPSFPLSILLKHTLTAPDALFSKTTNDIEIATRITLEPNGTISLRVKYNNTVKDGRLRLVLPAGFYTETAHADGHFRIAERQRVPLRTPESAPERYKAYPGELDYPTMHMNDFVMLHSDALQTWIAARGIHEFELLDENHQTFVALTIHRAVGLLSTGDGRIRRCQAGPSIPVPGAQCLREITADVAFGVAYRANDGIAIQHARNFAHPVWAREMPYLPHLKSQEVLARRTGSVEISNPHVALSSVRLHPDGETGVLRVYNLSDEAESTIIQTSLPYTKWAEADLHEKWDDNNPNRVENGQISCTLKPHQILTILLR